jgi:hypothetical protein
MCGTDSGFTTYGFGIKDPDFYGGQIALKVVSNKVTKRVLTINMLLYYLRLTLVFLAPEVVRFLQRVENVMHNNIVSHRSMNIIFKRIDFPIQNGLAAQLVTKLSFIHV